MDTLYLGGVHETIAEKLIKRVYPNENKQVEPKLIGCIGAVSLIEPVDGDEYFYEALSDEAVITFDRSYNHRSYGAKFGTTPCPTPDSESWLVSFNGRPTSFYSFSTANVERIAFMLKTTKPGLVFYLVSDGWSLECSVSFEDRQLRKIIVVYRNSKEYVKLAVPVKKVPGEWISVLVALNTNEKELILNVDDLDIWTEPVERLLPGDGNVILEGKVDGFLGGAGPHSESLDFGLSLDGCIGRLFINNRPEIFHLVAGAKYRYVILLMILQFYKKKISDLVIALFKANDWRHQLANSIAKQLCLTFLNYRKIHTAILLANQHQMFDLWPNLASMKEFLYL